MNTADNLRTLASYIEKHVSQEFINMESYYDAYADACPLEDSPWMTDQESLEYVVDHGIECGTSACALGHAAVIWPNEAKTSTDWDDFMHTVFPNDGTLRFQVFAGDLSSDKTEVVGRLRDAADDL